MTPISIEPKEHGLGFDSLDGLQVSTAADSADLIRSAFGGASDEASHKARAIIALNAGVGIYVSGRAGSLAAGFDQACEVLRSGAAAEKLSDFVRFTQTLASDGDAVSHS